MAFREVNLFQAPLYKRKFKKWKHKEKKIKTSVPVTKEEIYMHYLNIPNNVFTPSSIPCGLYEKILKILNFFFCWVGKTYQSGEINSRKQKSAQFIQEIIKRLTEHLFPSGWHDFISAFYFYSHPDDQSCYAQQPVKMCYISKSGMFCSSFPRSPHILIGQVNSNWYLERNKSID